MLYRILKLKAKTHQVNFVYCFANISEKCSIWQVFFNSFPVRIATHVKDCGMLVWFFVPAFSKPVAGAWHRIIKSKRKRQLSSFLFSVFIDCSVQHHVTLKTSSALGFVGGDVAAWFDRFFRANYKHKMKGNISFASEQTNSPFLIGQLVH